MIGFLNIYKPSGMTSNAVVQKVKKKFGLKKIGHMGTLDPMACGLLPLGVGKATRLFDYMLSKTKSYRVIFDFGYETDTLDITGKITNSQIDIVSSQDVINEEFYNKINFSSFEISEKLIKSKLNQLVGKISQVPPKFSAKNVSGERAYNLARAGIEFELKPKEIEIYKIILTKKISKFRYEFEVSCSSGTYIRAIGRDLAKLLGTYATMSFLERFDLGLFNMDNSIKLEDLLNGNLNDFMLSPLQVLKDYDIINIDKETYHDLINGKFVKSEKINKNTFVLYNGEILGIAKPRENQLKLDTFLKE